ncbi:MAG: MCE family protein [Candidatus Omnitrophica bacterium]|nr:MCE family protein [Candidatus Omnitrophota bacterium]
MPRESNLEVKVGIFVVAAIVTIVVFIFSISDFSIFQKGSTFHVVFNYANGLKKGSPVRFAGVDAGHVVTLKPFVDTADSQTKVNVDVWIAQGTLVPVDSNVMINQLGILGEKYLEIVPGKSTVSAGPGTVLRGEDPVPMETIMKMLSGIATKLDGTLAGVNDGILTEPNKKALAETLANMAVFTGMLKNGDGTMGKFLTDKSVYQNLEELTADVKANPWKLFYRSRGKK